MNEVYDSLSFGNPVIIDIKFTYQQILEDSSLAKMARFYKNASETDKNLMSHKLFLELRDKGLYSIDYYWISSYSFDGDDNVDRYENWPSDVRLFVRQFIDQLFDELSKN